MLGLITVNWANKGGLYPVYNFGVLIRLFIIKKLSDFPGNPPSRHTRLNQYTPTAMGLKSQISIFQPSQDYQ